MVAACQSHAANNVSMDDYKIVHSGLSNPYQLSVYKVLKEMSRHMCILITNYVCVMQKAFITCQPFLSFT